jgi:hypothetical protein
METAAPLARLLLYGGTMLAMRYFVADWWCGAGLGGLGFARPSHAGFIGRPRLNTASD